MLKDRQLTFVGVFGTYDELKIRTVAKAIGGDDFSLQLEDRDTCTIKCDTRRLLLRFKSKENGGRHGDRGSEEKGEVDQAVRLRHEHTIKAMPLRSEI